MTTEQAGTQTTPDAGGSPASGTGSPTPTSAPATTTPTPAPTGKKKKDDPRDALIDKYRSEAAAAESSRSALEAQLAKARARAEKAESHVLKLENRSRQSALVSAFKAKLPAATEAEIRGAVLDLADRGKLDRYATEDKHEEILKTTLPGLKETHPGLFRNVAGGGAGPANRDTPIKTSSDYPI